MKKSLIALAALAAVSAASAQSSVTLYGVLDIGYGSATTKNRDGNTSIKSRGVMDGANAGNRIGFRGTEDLGGGLKADFVIEQGINPTSGALFAQRTGNAGHQIGTNGPIVGGTTGANSGFQLDTNRQSYLGLSGANWGAVRIGYQYTNVYELGTLSGYNIGSEGMPGANAAHLQGVTAVGGTRANALTYISPNFSGFTVRAQYGSATSPGTGVASGNSVESQVVTNAGVVNETTGRRMSLMGQYANGPLSAALAYTNLKATSIVANVGGSRTGSLTQLGASYDFGVVKLAGTYNTGKDGLPVSTSHRAYQLGLSAPFGAIVPYISFGRAYTQLDGATGRATDLKQQQIGVRYSLSKRTTAYAMYGQTTNDAALSGTNTAYKDSKTLVGMMHSF